MRMDIKHKSKLHKGFEKQVIRQDKKAEIVKIVIQPIILSYNSKKADYVPLKQKFNNRKWNGMNLKNLCHDFLQVMPNTFNSHKRINTDGKYTLSLRGQQLLKRKRNVIKI